MVPYPKYSTTVIGAYSVPDWYEALDRLVSVGQLSMTAMADAQYRATQSAVLEQELAGIDVITGGEMHRRTHNRQRAAERDAESFLAENSGVPGQSRVPSRSRRTIPMCTIRPRPAAPAFKTTSISYWWTSSTPYRR